MQLVIVKENFSYCFRIIVCIIMEFLKKVDLQVMYKFSLWFQIVIKFFKNVLEIYSFIQIKCDLIGVIG